MTFPRSLEQVEGKGKPWYFVVEAEKGPSS
jgi:hypothetical protein